MGLEGNELLRRWGAVADALEAEDDSSLLPAMRSWIEEWDRRFWNADFSGFDRIYAPDFVGENRVPLGPDTDLCGPQAFPKLRDDISDVTSRFWFDIHEVERNGDRFAALGKMRGRGRYTGLLMRSSWAVVWTVRDRQITSAIAMRSHAKAREELARLYVYD